MNVSDEMIAAYAVGMANEEERKIMRKYLAESPQVRESMIKLMDPTYGMEPRVKAREPEQQVYEQPPMFSALRTNTSGFMCMSHFTPPRRETKSIDDHLTDLLSEIENM